MFILQILSVNNESEEFVYNHTLPSGELCSVSRGRELAQMSSRRHLVPPTPMSYTQMSDENHEIFAKSQQVFIIYYSIYIIIIINILIRSI